MERIGRLAVAAQPAPGFAHLPLGFFAVLLLMVAAYLALAEAGKHEFFTHLGGATAERPRRRRHMPLRSSVSNAAACLAVFSTRRDHRLWSTVREFAMLRMSSPPWACLAERLPRLTLGREDMANVVSGSVAGPQVGDAAGKRCWLLRPSLPVVEQVPVSISDAEQLRLRGLAARLARQEPALARAGDFGDGRIRQGIGEGPAVFFEDHREITLFSEGRASALEYRAWLLAGDGDLVALSGRRDRHFEAYARDVLQLGAPHGLCPPPDDATSSLPKRLRVAPDTLGRLAGLARRDRGLTVIPYLATSSVWALAAAVARESDVDVHVAAPLPTLTSAVNDKLWFARRVAEVLGPQALPPTFSAFGPRALAARLGLLGRRHPRLVVKVPGSAGGLGNVVLDATEVARLEGDALLRVVWDRIGQPNDGWTFPLLVGSWEDRVVDSPSVQLWVPHRSDGLPFVEGVFSQLLKKERGQFVGATPSALSDRWKVMIAGEALRLAFLLQEIGYFGRCGFDAVLVGDDPSCARLHWLECNGRWGSVSTAMTVANRLVGDWQRRPFAVVHRAGLRLPSRPLPAILEQLGSRLYQPGGRETGVVLLDPRRIVKGRGLSFMILADDPGTALAEAQAVSELLTHQEPHRR